MFTVNVGEEIYVFIETINFLQFALQMSGEPIFVWH